jgi:cAMP-dependent protein kinase regulator
MEENKEYLNSQIKPILDALFFNLLTHRPNDVLSFTLDWLIKQGGYTANGLTLGEREELGELRKKLSITRELIELSLEDSSESENEGDDNDNMIHLVDDLLENENFKKKRDTLIARGPRIAVSAESYGNKKNNKDYLAIIHQKTESQISRIKSIVINSFLFKSLESNELKVVIDAMEMKAFKKGEIVIKQGDQGNCLYIIEQGDLNCFKSLKNGERSLVKQYSQGDVFGELSLLYNSPRAAEVLAANDVILWELDRATFNFIVKDAAA